MWTCSMWTCTMGGASALQAAPVQAKTLNLIEFWLFRRSFLTLTYLLTVTVTVKYRACTALLLIFRS